MEFVQELAAVGAVLALLAATLWWLRRRGFAALVPRRRTAAGRLRASSACPGPQHTLHLVRVGDTAVLLASPLRQVVRWFRACRASMPKGLGRQFGEGNPRFIGSAHRAIPAAAAPAEPSPYSAYRPERMVPA